jgi:hypothetical protein
VTKDHDNLGLGGGDIGKGFNEERVSALLNTGDPNQPGFPKEAWACRIEELTIGIRAGIEVDYFKLGVNAPHTILQNLQGAVCKKRLVSAKENQCRFSNAVPGHDGSG